MSGFLGLPRPDPTFNFALVPPPFAQVERLEIFRRDQTGAEMRYPHPGHIPAVIAALQAEWDAQGIILIRHYLPTGDVREFYAENGHIYEVAA